MIYGSFFDFLILFCGIVFVFVDKTVPFSCLFTIVSCKSILVPPHDQRPRGMKKEVSGDDEKSVGKSRNRLRIFRQVFGMLISVLRKISSVPGGNLDTFSWPEKILSGDKKISSGDNFLFHDDTVRFSRKFCERLNGGFAALKTVVSRAGVSRANPQIPVPVPCRWGWPMAACRERCCRWAGERSGLTPRAQ